MLRSIAHLYKIHLATLAATTLLTGAAHGQLSLSQGHQAGDEPRIAPPPELRQRYVELDIDTGFLQNTGQQDRVIFETTIDVPEATSLRLQFGNVFLSEQHGGSFLRLTSLHDGAIQTLNSEALRQWQNTSAYFNGSSLRVELVASPGSGINRLDIDAVMAGEQNTPQGKGIGTGAGDIGGGGAGDIGDIVNFTQCGPTDDRELSDDPLSARVMPIGCTVFLINDAGGCFLTAGHCSGGSALQVVEFNVPLSDPDGSNNHPGPEDQYPVDPASLQFVNGGPGNDWGYFGCFPNTQTGLTAAEAQGGTYIMANPPSVGSTEIRITGYGADSGERDNVQQTHAGPYTDFEGTRLRYQADTQGGNSGSGVQNDTTGEVVGIHTHGGCGQTGGSNTGTAMTNSGLQNALANPQGICDVSLEFSYPNGRPQLLDPSGNTTFTVLIEAGNNTDPAPGTGVLHYNAGNGYIAVPMNDLGNNQYEAVFPAIPCGTVVSYFFTAESTTGQEFSDPPNAPNVTYSAVSAVSVTTTFADNFQTNTGWTVESDNSLEGGEWERGIPADGNRGDPGADFDGSGRCYLTENFAGNSDVDGGPTRLISPTIDVADDNDATFSYAWWFTNDDNDQDRLVVEVSNNNGSSWTQVRSFSDAVGWNTDSFLISDFVSPTSQVVVRFSATDNPNDSVTEAAIDAVSVTTLNCGSSNTDLVSVAVERGTYVSGDLSDIQDSDDSYFVARSAFGFLSSEPNLLEVRVRATTDNVSPTTIDLGIESRNNNPGAVATVRLRNYASNSLEQVAQYNVSQTDSIFSLPSVAAGDFVRSSDGRVEMNVKQVVIATFSLSGFQAFFDEVTVDVN